MTCLKQRRSEIKQETRKVLCNEYIEKIVKKKEIKTIRNYTKLAERQ